MSTQRQRYEADNLLFAVELIKKHGERGACDRFRQAVVRFDGPQWEASAVGLFDLAVSVASDAIQYDGGNHGPLPQSIIADVLAGKIPSNIETAPQEHRDAWLADLDAPTETRQ